MKKKRLNLIKGTASWWTNSYKWTFEIGGQPVSKLQYLNWYITFCASYYKNRQDAWCSIEELRSKK